MSSAPIGTSTDNQAPFMSRLSARLVSATTSPARCSSSSEALRRISLIAVNASVTSVAVASTRPVAKATDRRRATSRPARASCERRRPNLTA